jgi:hypothetical protein
MRPKANWKGVFSKFRKPWVMTIGGLFLGAAGAAIFVVLLNYVIQPQMSVETRDIYAVRDDRFNVWYHDGSPERARYTELKARLEESLDDLLVRLAIDPSEIPMPIDVVVHDDAGQLQSSIVQRKSLLATYTFSGAVFDLFAGEDPYPRLTELLLAFGWGQCYSQLLYTGATMVLADPDRSFHPTVAAAPPRLRYSLEELLQLDASGQFSQTLYQQLDSPFSARMAFGSLESIAAFYSLFGSEENLVPDEDFASLQAASLVEYLIQCNGGIEALKAVWGPGTSRALFERLACGPLDDLSEAWHRTAIADGQTGALYDYYRALYLFEAGEFEEAHRLTQAWRDRTLDDEDVVLAARCAISVGEFEEASEWLEDAGLTSGQPAEWAALFSGWRGVSSDGVTVFGDLSEEELSRLLAGVREARERVATGLALSEDDLPQRITVFFYENAETRQAGQGVTPADSMNQTAWHVVVGEDVGWALASTLPAYAYRVGTASNLLRTGLATAVTVGWEDLVAQGCRILTEGAWTPLWQLGFGGVSPEQFRVETGLMIRHLIDVHGLEIVRQLWHATARGGGMSFDSAILEYAGTSRRDIERALLNSVLVCD